MLVKLLRFDPRDTTSVKFADDDVELGTEILFSARSLAGSATLLSYRRLLARGVIKEGSSLEVSPDFLSISRFAEASRQVQKIDPIEGGRDYWIVGQVGYVDPFGGNDVGVVVDDFIFSIDERLVPRQRWDRLAEGDWVEFAGHDLLLWA